MDHYLLKVQIEVDESDITLQDFDLLDLDCLIDG